MTLNPCERQVLPFHRFVHESLLLHFPLDLCTIIHQFFEYPFLFYQKQVETIHRRLNANHKKNHRHYAMKRMKKEFDEWFTKEETKRKMKALSKHSFSIFCFMEKKAQDFNLGSCNRVNWPIILTSILHILSKTKVQGGNRSILKKSDISKVVPKENQQKQYSFSYFYDLHYQTFDFLETHWDKII